MCDILIISGCLLWAYFPVFSCKVANLQFALYPESLFSCLLSQLQCCVLMFEFGHTLLQLKSILLEEIWGYQFHKVPLSQVKISKPGLSWNNVKPLSDIPKCSVEGEGKQPEAFSLVSPGMEPPHVLRQRSKTKVVHVPVILSMPYPR